MSVKVKSYTAVALLEYTQQNANEVSVDRNESVTVLSLQGDWAVVRKANGDKGLVPSALISEPNMDEEEEEEPAKKVTSVPNVAVVPKPGSRTSSPASPTSRDAMMATLMSTTSTQDGPWKTSTISVVKGDGDAFLTLRENEPVTVIDFYPPSWCRVEVRGTVGLVPKDLLNPTFIGINGVPSTNFKNRRPILFLARAKFDYTGKGKTELSFKAGDVIGIKKEVSGGWYVATIDRRTGHVPASFFTRVDFLADGVTPATPRSCSPKTRPGPVVPPRSVGSPGPAPGTPRTVPSTPTSTEAQQEKKRLVLRRKSVASKELVQMAEAAHAAPPPDDINALPTYDEIEPMTVATLKSMFDEAQKRHAEEMAAMKALAEAQLAEIDKLKQHVIALDARLSKLQSTVDDTLSQVEIVEE